MAVRMMVLIKRKPGLTAEQFREGYETGHARMAVRLFGHLWSEYRRHYLGSANSFAQGQGVPTDGAPSEAPSIGFDVITEFVFRDAAGLAENNRILLANLAEIEADEARWFDRPNCWLITCDTVEDEVSQIRLSER